MIKYVNPSWSWAKSKRGKKKEGKKKGKKETSFRENARVADMFLHRQTDYVF